MKISFRRKDYKHYRLQYFMYLNNKLNEKGYRVIYDEEDNHFILGKYRYEHTDIQDCQRILDRPYLQLEEAKYDLINFYYTSFK